MKQKVLWFVKINRISLWRAFPRRQADVLLFWGCIPPLITKVLITCFDKHQVENMKRFVPEWDNIYFPWLLCTQNVQKCQNQSRDKTFWPHSIYKITVFKGKSMCILKSYTIIFCSILSFKYCVCGAKHQWRMAAGWWPCNWLEVQRCTRQRCQAVETSRSAT